MKKIKILQVGLSSNLGGIEKYLINIHRNIDFDKFQIDYLVFKGENVCFYNEISKKSKIYSITHRNKNYIKFLKELKKFLKETSYDYIHFNLMEFSCFERIIYARKYTKSKIILHSHIANHQMPNLKTKILNEIGKFLIKRKDIYIKAACSKEAGIYMFKDFKNKKFTILNNGIDIDEFKFNQANRNEIRKKLQIDNSLVIGNIGRLVYQKNHTFLLDIFSEILKLKKDAILLIIGKGELRNKLEEKASKLNITKKIIYIENTNKVNEYLSAMDVFLFPSLFEGLGIVLIEAQASGLKCFITDSLPDVINVTKNIERISLDKSAKEWAKEIVNIENCNKNEERLLVNKELKKSEFDVKNSVKILEKFYIDKLGEN